MADYSLIQVIAILVVPVLFAITVHEVAHGWVALQFGDRTAQMLGRLTLNPLKHIDPLGTVLVPGFLLISTGYMFGWAKPVPVNERNMRNAKTNMAWVALAGPMANLIMAIMWMVLIKLGLSFYQNGISFGEPLVYMSAGGVIFNLVLMALNLLPIPPLDGGRILVSILPGPLAWQVSRLEPYGFFILLGLILSGVLGAVLSLILGPFIEVFSAIFDVPLQSIIDQLYRIVKSASL